MKTFVLLFSMMFMLVACTSHTPTSSSIAAKVVQIDEGFGGTGHSPIDESGFGGTGAVANLEESGFGGTGVIGTVEAFGSIWVNGLHIEFDHQREVAANLPGRYRLEIGQQVLLTANQVNNQIVSEQLRVYFPVAGNVEEIRRGHYRINGQWVRWNTLTQTDSHWSSAEALSIGDSVIVSGYQLDSGTWVATRFAANPQQLSHLETKITWPFDQAPKRFVIEQSLAQSLSERFKRLSPNSLLLRPGRFNENSPVGSGQNGGQSLQKRSGMRSGVGQATGNGIMQGAPMHGGKGH